MKYKIIICTLILGIVITGHQIFSVSADDCRNSTVIISDEAGWGSGVFISPHKILTAKHVVSDVNATYTITDIKDNKFNIVKIELDAYNDIAVITVKEEHSYTPLSKNKLQIGACVYICGSPLDLQVSFNYSKGIVTNLNKTIYIWSNVFITDAFAAGGSSGSPVFYKGKVIGIVVGANSQTTSLTVCEPVSNIDKWLLIRK